MDRIRTRRHLLSPKHMPSFIYKNYTLDTTDPYMGAFEGDLIVLVSTVVLVSHHEIDIF